MSFQSGKPKTGGRQPGTPNQLTGAFREAVLHVYKGLGGHAAFLAWAQGNPTEYYRIAARLIPVELHREEDRTIRVIIDDRSPLIQPSADVTPQQSPVLIQDSSTAEPGPWTPS
jgi:hypothetical protein